MYDFIDGVVSVKLTGPGAANWPFARMKNSLLGIPFSAGGRPVNSAAQAVKVLEGRVVRTRSSKCACGKLAPRPPSRRARPGSSPARSIR